MQGLSVEYLEFNALMLERAWAISAASSAITFAGASLKSVSKANHKLASLLPK